MPPKVRGVWGRGTRLGAVGWRHGDEAQETYKKCVAVARANAQTTRQKSSSLLINRGLMQLGELQKTLLG